VFTSYEITGFSERNLLLQNLQEWVIIILFTLHHPDLIPHL